LDIQSYFLCFLVWTDYNTADCSALIYGLLVKSSRLIIGLGFKSSPF